MVERVVKERAYRGEARFGVACADCDGNHAHIPFGRRCGKTEARFVRKARFSAVAPVVTADELIRVRHLRRSAVGVRKVFQPDAGIFMVFFMPDQRAQHDRDVFGARILRLFRKSRAVCKQRIFRAEFLCALVHSLAERAFASADALGNRHAGVVCGTYGNALQQRVRLIGQSRAEKYLRTAHSRRALGNGDFFIERKLSALLRLERKKQRHYFAHTRDGKAFRFILRVQLHSARFVHQIRRLAGGRKLVFIGGNGAHRSRSHRRRKR